MDCFCCCDNASVLPSKHQELSRTSRRDDPYLCSGTQPTFRLHKEQLDWCSDMSWHWLLLAAGTHTSLRRIQKFIYKEQWHFELSWDCSVGGVSSLGSTIYTPIDVLLHFLASSSFVSNLKYAYTYMCVFVYLPMRSFQLVFQFVSSFMLLVIVTVICLSVIIN